jgi:hypothetical protein
MRIGRSYSVSCPRHRRLNPADRGSVRGGCQICNLICDAYQAAKKLDFLIQEIEDRTYFERRAKECRTK